MSVRSRRGSPSVVLLLALLGCCGGSDDSDPEDESAPADDAGPSHDEGSDDEAFDDAGADERDAGPPPMVCVGLANECSRDLDEEGCRAIRGCAWITECGGVVYQCLSQSNAANCNAVAGCEWDGVDTCNGESLSCWRFDEDEPGCGAQPGCDWAEECGGKPEPCPALNEAECTLQPGCRLIPDPNF